MLEQNTEEHFLLSSYTYNLPEDLIAQYPKERGASRLLIMDKVTGAVTHTDFTSLIDYLPKGALLVANNTQVLPVRIASTFCTGGRFEVLLLTPMPFIELRAKTCIERSGWYTATAEVLIKPSKKIFIGETIVLYDTLEFFVLKKKAFGRYFVRLTWVGSLKKLLFMYGHIPLPPYIQRKDTDLDVQTYQTVYAKEACYGSIAAPTAGLHFSEHLLAQVKEHGFSWLEITLHVGYGTFSPVRTQDIREHEMHKEYVQISLEVAQAIQKAKEEGRPIIAIGTTVVRALEGVSNIKGTLSPYSGWIKSFIKPGYSFHIVDGLITNFHQPESTLLMLVSAFTGRKKLLSAYQEAIEQRYRFFSYGDAMFIL